MQRPPSYLPHPDDVEAGLVTQKHVAQAGYRALYDLVTNHTPHVWQRVNSLAWQMRALMAMVGAVTVVLVGEFITGLLRS